MQKQSNRRIWIIKSNLNIKTIQTSIYLQNVAYFF